MKDGMGRWLLGALCAAAVGFRTGAEEISVSADETLVLSVTNATVCVRPGIEGSLRKEGAASLTLDDANFPNGSVALREGALTLLATNETVTAKLPAWAQAAAVLWFDANTNAVTGVDTNGVIQWLDAREPDQAAPYLYARAVQHSDTPIPLLGIDVALGGQRYLDFGGFGSDRWLKWVNPDDSRLAVSNIVHAFIVFGRQPGFGFLLGDWDWNQAGNVGRKDFHISDLGSGGTNCFFWNTLDTAATVVYGRTCLNGVLIDGLRTKPDEGYQVFDVTTMGSALASNFCNDHNFKVGDASGQVGYDRQGGPRYCEVLVFTNQLTATQRGEVLDYLSAKWMTRSRRTGVLASLNGARLEADVGAGQTLAVGKLSGEGCLTKTGEGTLRFANDPALFRGVVRLAAGTVESALQRTDRTFVAETGGQAFEAGTSAVIRTVLADATLFQKTGSGTLTLSGVSNAVARVDVTAGTLRLSAPFVPTTEVVRVSVPNASFEDHGTISSGTYQTGLNPTGWTLITSGSTGKGGITLDRSTTPWVTQGAIPDGESAVFFQYDGGIKTTVTVSRAGSYQLSFQAAGRADGTGYRQHDFGVWLGTQKVAVAKTYDPVFKRYEYVTPSLTNGAYELRFQGLVGTVNRASVIDDVRLDLKETAVAVDLPNGGFEYSDHFGTDSVPTVYAMSPAGAEWTFEGSNLCGIAEATPSVVPGTYFTRSVPEGSRCAFIKSNAVIRQTFRFPTTGEVYRLSFQTAGREKYEGHAFKVLVDGEPLIPYMRTALSTFHSCSVTLPLVTNWTAEIAFVGLTTNSTTLISLFDDVRIVRADDVTVFNGSFETTTSLSEGDTSGYATLCAGAGWTFEQDVDARKPGISGTGFGEPPLGGRVAFIQGYAVIRQTLTLPGAGTYLLSFQAAGRPGYLGHAFEVCWGGTRLGVVAADSTAFRTYTFRLPYVAGAESKELLFRGLVRLPIFSLIDDVKIERTAVGSIEGLLPKTTDVSVASGAKLDLDFSGTLAVKSVTLGTQEKSRIISAETCPEYVTGTGALYTPAKGTVISVQ